MELIKLELLLIQNLGIETAITFGYIRMKCEKQNNHSCFISYNDIVKLLGQSKYNISQYVKKLEELGIITCQLEKYPIKKSYIINYNKLYELLDFYRKTKDIGGI